MLIVVVRWAVITAARVLATASAALVGFANVLGLSTEAKSKPAGSRRKVDRLEKQGFSHEPTDDCQYESRKSGFLKAAENAYGYGGKLENLSMAEFSRLRGRNYVDHAGATLYSERQIKATYQVALASDAYLLLIGFQSNRGLVLLCFPHGCPCLDTSGLTV